MIGGEGKLVVIWWKEWRGGEGEFGGNSIVISWIEWHGGKKEIRW